MATAAEFLHVYREQTGLDADDTIALLVDFLSTYGIAERAVDALCDCIDDEGIAEDFSRLLQENGLAIEAGDDLGDEDEE